ncbi:MAG TPA: hypothetical protein VNZ54_07455, partial [bacterium]|nr:hypothetical protein [bacterium]
AGPVRLMLYDLTGANVLDAPLGDLEQGDHRASLDLGRCAPGLYLLLLCQDTGSGYAPLAHFKLAVAP